MSSQDELTIEIWLKPNSKNQQIEYDGKILHISVTSAPKKGKANKELIDIISRIFDISTVQIQMISGHKSRTKLLKISNIQTPEIEKKLIKYLPTQMRR